MDQGPISTAQPIPAPISGAHQHYQAFNHSSPANYHRQLRLFEEKIAEESLGILNHDGSPSPTFRNHRLQKNSHSHSLSQNHANGAAHTNGFHRRRTSNQPQISQQQQQPQTQIQQQTQAQPQVYAVESVKHSSFSFPNSYSFSSSMSVNESQSQSPLPLSPPTPSHVPMPIAMTMPMNAQQEQQHANNTSNGNSNSNSNGNSNNGNVLASASNSSTGGRLSNGSDHRPVFSSVPTVPYAQISLSDSALLSLTSIAFPPFEAAFYRNEKPKHIKYIFHFHTAPCVSFSSTNSSPNDALTCPYEHRKVHGLNICFDFHSLKSRRRIPRILSSNGSLYFSYNACRCVSLEKEIPCERGDSCRYAHTKEEIAFHPSRYKTQLCSFPFIPNTNICSRFGLHCAFAHGEEDLRKPIVLQSGKEKLSNVMAQMNGNSDTNPMNGMSPAELTQQRSPITPGKALVGSLSPISSTSGASTPLSAYSDDGDSSSSSSSSSTVSSLASSATVSSSVCPPAAPLELGHSNSFNNGHICPPQELEDDREFYMYSYMTQKCVDAASGHCSRALCPFYHFDSKRRRNPRIYRYSHEPCANVKVSSSVSSASGVDSNNSSHGWLHPSVCPNGDACPFSHTLLESMYHPNVYKTVLCANFNADAASKGEEQKCKFGRQCAHAHAKSELRVVGGAGGAGGGGGEGVNERVQSPHPPYQNAAANKRHSFNHLSPSVNSVGTVLASVNMGNNRESPHPHAHNSRRSASMQMNQRRSRGYPESPNAAPPASGGASGVVAHFPRPSLFNSDFSINEEVFQQQQQQQQQAAQQLQQQQESLAMAALLKEKEKEIHLLKIQLTSMKESVQQLEKENYYLKKFHERGRSDFNPTFSNFGANHAVSATHHSPPVSSVATPSPNSGNGNGNGNSPSVNVNVHHLPVPAHPGNGRSLSLFASPSDRPHPNLNVFAAFQAANVSSQSAHASANAHTHPHPHALSPPPAVHSPPVNGIAASVPVQAADHSNSGTNQVHGHHPSNSFGDRSMFVGDLSSVVEGNVEEEDFRTEEERFQGIVRDLELHH